MLPAVSTHSDPHSFHLLTNMSPPITKSDSPYSKFLLAVNGSLVRLLFVKSRHSQKYWIKSPQRRGKLQKTCHREGSSRDTDTKMWILKLSSHPKGHPLNSLLSLYRCESLACTQFPCNKWQILLNCALLVVVGCIPSLNSF